MNFTQKLCLLSAVAVLGLMLLLNFHSGPRNDSSTQQNLMLYCAAGVKPAVIKAAVAVSLIMIIMAIIVLVITRIWGKLEVSL
jgi:hypothetical protein